MMNMDTGKDMEAGETQRGKREQQLGCLSEQLESTVGR
jgi:hypothetical protein